MLCVLILPWPQMSPQHGKWWLWSTFSLYWWSWYHLQPPKNSVREVVHWEDSCTLPIYLCIPFHLHKINHRMQVILMSWGSRKRYYKDSGQNDKWHGKSWLFRTLETLQLEYCAGLFLTPAAQLDMRRIYFFVYLSPTSEDIKTKSSAFIPS